MELTTRYRIKEHIKLRREKFGGLLYDHENGNLQFIHSHILVSFLENNGELTVEEMANQIFSPQQPPQNLLSKVLDNLAKFNQRGIIYEV